jgi:hypothetical protein
MPHQMNSAGTVGLASAEHVDCHQDAEKVVAEVLQGAYVFQRPVNFPVSTTH